MKDVGEIMKVYQDINKETIDRWVEDVQHIFNESYRVLKQGGIFLAGLNNEINYIVDSEEKELFGKCLLIH